MDQQSRSLKAKPYSSRYMPSTFNSRTRAGVRGRLNGLPGRHARTGVHFGAIGPVLSSAVGVDQLPGAAELPAQLAAFFEQVAFDVEPDRHTLRLNAGDGVAERLLAALEIIVGRIVADAAVDPPVGAAVAPVEQMEIVDAAELAPGFLDGSIQMELAPRRVVERVVAPKASLAEVEYLAEPRLTRLLGPVPPAKPPAIGVKTSMPVAVGEGQHGRRRLDLLARSERLLGILHADGEPVGLLRE